MDKLIDEMTNLCIEHNHTIQSKHIAVLTKKAHPITNYVYNQGFGCYGSIHAEIAAIIDYLKFNRCYEKRVGFQEWELDKQCVL